MSKKRKGWICPNCGMGIHPEVETCDCIYQLSESTPTEPTLTLVKETAPEPDKPQPQPYVWPIPTTTSWTCANCRKTVYPGITHYCWPNYWTTTINTSRVAWRQLPLW